LQIHRFKLSNNRCRFIVLNSATKESVMRGMMRVLSVMIVGFFWFIASAEIASAQTIIKAVYRVSMTDPANGNVYFVDREGKRSWQTEDVCEAQKKSFSGFHTSAMARQKITNSDGTPLEVKMDSIFCVVIRP